MYRRTRNVTYIRILLVKTNSEQVLAFLAFWCQNSEKNKGPILIPLGMTRLVHAANYFILSIKLIGTKNDVKQIFIYNTAIFNKNLDLWVIVIFARLRRNQKLTIIA